MPRTRDLVLFVVIVCCLGIGIAVTYLFENQQFLFGDSAVVLSVNKTTSSSTFTAVAPEKKRDRESFIARLRTALLQSDEPTVNPSVETIAEEKSPEKVPPKKENSDVILQRCTTSDDALLVMQHWPLQNVSIDVKDGIRTVVFTPPAQVLPVDEMATTTSVDVPTASPIDPQVLLSMHMYPSVQGSISCVPSEVVGVTVSGSLMSNTDAHLYVGRSAGELLGYARDGFPIYGTYEGETDVCGGYVHPEGYRYTISSTREFVLGCFVATVQPFLLK